MIRLFDSLPKGVTVGKKFYRLDFDFRNVLRMMETLGRDDLVPEARDYLAIKCLTKHPRNVKAVLSAVQDLLFEKTPASGERVTSFEQDAGLIRTAFRQVYGIDLFTAKLHWLAFVELLQNLPEGNKYEEIVGIRARPMPAPTKYNQKEREWLMKAKQAYTLHLTEAEQAKKYDHDVAKIFGGIMGLMQRAEEVNKHE